MGCTAAVMRCQVWRHGRVVNSVFDESLNKVPHGVKADDSGGQRNSGLSSFPNRPNQRSNNVTLKNLQQYRLAWSTTYVSWGMSQSELVSKQTKKGRNHWTIFSFNLCEPTQYSVIEREIGSCSAYAEHTTICLKGNKQKKSEEILILNISHY